MADVPISALVPLGAAPDPTDLLPMVDTSDTSQGPSGSTKRMNVGNLFTAPVFSGNVTIGGQLVVQGPLVSNGGISGTTATLTGTLSVAGATALATLSTTGLITSGGNVFIPHGSVLNSRRNSGALLMRLVGIDAGTDVMSMAEPGIDLHSAAATNTFTGPVTVGGDFTAGANLVVVGAITGGSSVALGGAAHNAPGQVSFRNNTDSQVFQIGSSGAPDGRDFLIFNSTLGQTVMSITNLNAAFTGSVTTNKIAVVQGAAVAAGSIVNTPVAGLVISAATGSTFDFVLATPAGGDIMEVPTATLNAVFRGTVTAPAFVMPSDVSGKISIGRFGPGASSYSYLIAGANSLGFRFQNNSAADLLTLDNAGSIVMAVGATLDVGGSVGIGSVAGRLRISKIDGQTLAIIGENNGFCAINPGAILLPASAQTAVDGLLWYNGVSLFFRVGGVTKTVQLI